MQIINGFNIGGIESRQNPSIKGNGAPTTSTVGAVGCLYIDTDTGEMYKCTAVSSGKYTWVALGGSSDSEYTQPEWGKAPTYTPKIVVKGFKCTMTSGDAPSDLGMADFYRYMSQAEYNEMMSAPDLVTDMSVYSNETQEFHWERIPTPTFEYEAKRGYAYTTGFGIPDTDIGATIRVLYSVEATTSKVVTKTLTYNENYNKLLASVTEEEYGTMLGSEDFEAIYDDKYSGVYHLKATDFEHLNGELSFYDADAQEGATINIYCTNTHYEKVPLEYLETPEQNVPYLMGTDKNPVILWNLKVGSYIVDGVARAYPGSKGDIRWWRQFIVVSPVPAQNAVYVQAFYPASHAVHQYTIKNEDGQYSYQVSKVYLNDIVSDDDVGSKRLVGTSKNPICLRNLATGSYVVDGTIKLYPTESATRSWDETLINVSQKSDGTTTYVQAHFPASHSIHLFTITDSKSTLTSTSLSKILDDIAALKAKVGI